MKSKFLERKSAPLVLILVASLLLSAGCGSKYGPQTVKVQYYPDCYQPVADLRSADEKMRKDVLTGALVGAATGLVVGLATSGTARGAVIGTAVGLVAGLAGSYLISSSLQEKALQERFAAYNTAIDAETNNLNVAVKFAKATCDCYSSSYKALKKAYQKGGMSKEEMLVRLKEIRDGNNDAIRVLEIYKADYVKHTETFDEVVRLEQARTADRAPKNTVSQFKKKQTTFSAAAKRTDNTLDLLTKNNRIIEDEINARELAIRGANILAVNGQDPPAQAR
ncbi:MAG: hypothetical protein LBP92_10385 [Deltaproteobacteria bacterium]|jgi:hypothetical protein|nr:hypothetical protein [Deltaproteobacteria bacterium]